jgi:hypothetical protein
MKEASGIFALTIGKDESLYAMSLPFLRHPFGSRKFNIRSINRCLKLG